MIMSQLLVMPSDFNKNEDSYQLDGQDRLEIMVLVNADDRSNC